MQPTASMIGQTDQFCCADTDLNRCCSSAVQTDTSFTKCFDDWAYTFDKEYGVGSSGPAEKARRMAIYKGNIQRMLGKNDVEMHSFWMQPTFYTDWTGGSVLHTLRVLTVSIALGVLCSAVVPEAQRCSGRVRNPNWMQLTFSTGGVGVRALWMLWTAA